MSASLVRDYILYINYIHINKLKPYILWGFVNS